MLKERFVSYKFKICNVFNLYEVATPDSKHARGVGIRQR